MEVVAEVGGAHAQCGVEWQRLGAQTYAPWTLPQVLSSGFNPDSRLLLTPRPSLSGHAPHDRQTRDGPK